MAVFPKMSKPDPKKSNHDLSHYFDTSMAAGVGVPILCVECNGNEEHRISVESLVNTQALLSPLYGTYKLQLTAFFAPISLYIPKLRNNSALTSFGGETVSGLLDAPFPTGYITQDQEASATLKCVHPSSLLAHLGYACNQPLGNIQNGAKFNMLPLLMYYDIFRNYFANRQEEKFPIMTDSSAPHSDDTSRAFATMQSLDNMYAQLEDGDSWNFEVPAANGVIESAFKHADKPLAGMWCHCYLPDRMTVFLNKSFYDANVSSVKVNIDNGSFQIDQLVTAKKLWDSRNNDMMTNKTFKDWVRVHFGSTPKVLPNQPTFLGASSSDLYFEDIRATTSAKIGDSDQYLGDKASTGKGYNKTRMFRCFADQPGYIMVIASLIPRVKYYQQMERYVLHNKLSDMFRPEYNGVGFQDILQSDICLDFDKQTQPTASELDYMYYNKLGKHPAWLEYTTAIDRARGTFCTTEKSWVLLRDMWGAKRPTGATALFPALTSYINPGEWNQPFAIQDPTAQNFLCQFYFDHTTRSTVSKRLLPYF